MRQGIRPLCTTDRVPMNLASLASQLPYKARHSSAMNRTVRRAYNTSMGYFDILATDTTATIRSARALVTKRPCFWKNLRALAESGIAVGLGCDLKRNVLAASVKLDCAALWPKGFPAGMIEIRVYQFWADRLCAGYRARLPLHAGENAFSANYHSERWPRSSACSAWSGMFLNRYRANRCRVAPAAWGH